MAPEQMKGSSSIASDQSGFCVSLFQALFGKFPFASRGRRLAEIQKGVSVPPLDGIASKNHRILEAVFTTGLKADPGDRFKNMQELLGKLRKVC